MPQLNDLTSMSQLWWLDDDVWYRVVGNNLLYFHRRWLQLITFCFFETQFASLLFKKLHPQNSVSWCALNVTLGLPLRAASPSLSPGCCLMMLPWCWWPGTWGTWGTWGTPNWWPWPGVSSSSPALSLKPPLLSTSSLLARLRDPPLARPEK